MENIKLDVWLGYEQQQLFSSLNQYHGVAANLFIWACSMLSRSVVLNGEDVVEGRERHGKILEKGGFWETCPRDYRAMDEDETSEWWGVKIVSIHG